MFYQKEDYTVAVKIRLKRFGRKNHPFWRINAVDSRSPRDGKVLEELGFYDPLERDAQRAVVVRKERVEHWLKVGAQPSPTVAQLLKHATDASELPAQQPRRPAPATSFTPAARPEAKVAAPAAPAAPAPQPEAPAATDAAPPPQQPASESPGQGESGESPAGA